MEAYRVICDPALLADCWKTTVPGVALESPAELASTFGKAASLGDGSSLDDRGLGFTIGSTSAHRVGTCAPALTVTALCEHVDRYTGIVSFRPGAQGQVQIRERQLEGEDCYEDAAWSLELAVGSDSAVLRVAWPVVVRSANLRVSRKNGTVSFSIPKSAAWPPMGGKKLSMEALQLWPPGSAGKERLDLCVQGMFRLGKMMLSMQPSWVPEGHHLGLRNCLHVMFAWLKEQEPACFVVMDPDNGGGPNWTLSISAQRLREAPGGFPVLEVVYNDIDRMQRLLVERRIAIADADIFAYCVGTLESRHVVELHLPAGVIKLLLALLRRCSSLVQPPVWQRSHAEQHPGWVASFLPLVYPEDVPPFEGTVPPTITPRMVPSSKIVARACPPEVVEAPCEQDEAAAEKPPPKLTSGASKGASGTGDALLVASGKVADAAGGLRREILDRGKLPKGAPKACDVCGVVDKKVHRCTVCKAAAYCSRECQKLAWPSHKELCKQSSGGGR
eukprot:jgi/Mesen1/4889/ME000244S04067